MSRVRAWFDAALTIADPVERAHAMGDLAFDAEQMLREGRREEATELSELLVTLDPDDDLLHPAIESAENQLVLAGVRTLPPLDVLVAGLHEKFGGLPERERMVAVAAALVRAHGYRRPQSWAVAADLLAAAQRMRPLAGKERRLHAEVLRRAISGGGNACDNARGGVGQAVASFAITSVKADAEESPGSTGHGAR